MSIILLILVINIAGVLLTTVLMGIMSADHEEWESTSGVAWLIWLWPLGLGLASVALMFTLIDKTLGICNSILKGIYDLTRTAMGKRKPLQIKNEPIKDPLEETFQVLETKTKKKKKV